MSHKTGAAVWSGCLVPRIGGRPARADLAARQPWIRPECLAKYAAAYICACGRDRFGGSVLVVRGFRRGDRFLLRNGDGGKQGLPLRLAETPAASRWPRRVVAADPSIESRSAREAERWKATRWNSLAMVLGKRSTIPFDGGLIVLIREWSISPRARELNFVMLWIAAIFCAAIGQHTQEFYLLFVEEGHDPSLAVPSSSLISRVNFKIRFLIVSRSATKTDGGISCHARLSA
jgi:hypothetical protein